MLRTLLMNYLREQAKERVMEAARDSMTQKSREGSPDEPPQPCDVALIFSLQIEAGGLVDQLTDPVTTRYASFVEHVGKIGSRTVVLVESGLGSQAAAAGTAEAITLHQVKYVVAAGFATSLQPSVKRGHLVLADEVVDAHGNHLAVDLHVKNESSEKGKSSALHIGRLLTIDHALREPAEKHRLGENHAALACDTDSLIVGQVCHERHVHFLAVRIVNEAVDDELPKDVERMIDQKSLPAKIGAAASAVWNRPSTIKDMWHLKEEAIKASDRLARFLVGVIGNLP